MSMRRIARWTALGLLGLGYQASFAADRPFADMAERPQRQAASSNYNQVAYEANPETAVPPPHAAAPSDAQLPAVPAPGSTDGMFCGTINNSDWFHSNGFYVDGWIDQGFTYNARRPSDGFNGPNTFNDQANKYQMNQLYFILGKEACQDPCEWGLGGRVDFLYGSDYFFTTALGLETHQNGLQHWNGNTGPGGGANIYGIALPQAYAEIYAPWANGLSVKLGHFYSPMGYESVMAPDNFFYSHTYTRQYGEPFTHTGALASYALNDSSTLLAGVTRGWDTFEDPNDSAGLLLGFTWASEDQRTSFAATFHSGNENLAGDQNRTNYTLVLSHCLSDRLRYVLEHVYGVQNQGALDENSNLTNATWYSFANYFLYAMNDDLDAGFRFEYFCDADNSRILAIPIDTLTEGSNYFPATVGLNYRPMKNVVIRPEARWDWSDVSANPLGVGGVYDTFSEKSQFTLAVDMIIRF